MNTIDAAKEVESGLNFRVDPIFPGSGRRIVCGNPEQQRRVTADGQVYDDGVWRVKLFTWRPQRQAIHHMLSVCYRGAKLPVRDKRRDCRVVFYTGWVTAEIVPNKEKVIAISLSASEYSGLLEQLYGIRNGFVLDSPNQTWYKDDDRDLMILSDGQVECQFDGRIVYAPSLEDFMMIRRARDVSFTVERANWTVMIQFEPDDPDSVEIWLYLESGLAFIVGQALGQYLEDCGLGRFDDLLLF